ncbi:MAG: hypothetical protein MUO26_12455 [Methanotrichaceae archaeon]|nr:hypothetical protein [Methanotrichaceae archaeon]
MSTASGKHWFQRAMAMVKFEKVILYLITITFLGVLTGAASANSGPPDDEISPGEGLAHGILGGHAISRGPPPPVGVPMDTIWGCGLALQNNETHPVRLIVERFVPICLREVRDFLASNKSIEEIREAIRAREEPELYRGIMRLDYIPYSMTNINVSSSKANAKIIDSDLALPVSDLETKNKIVGHLIVTVIRSQGGTIGEGLLDMNSAEHYGSYKILLDAAKCEIHLRGREKFGGFKK